ncbi:MAG: signal peptide peptidase SppA [Paludibacteraceae bacterium]|nr:signal peptide peptidase SppA [Paludibacteraceae bacterium]
MKQFMKLSIAVVFGLLLWAVIKVFLFFGLIGLIGSAASGVSSSKSTAKSGSVYELELRGAVVEYQDEKDRMTASLMSALDEDQYAIFGLNEILANIREAKTNPKIEGIYLHGGSMQMGYATAQALREALTDFRESGKFVVAYADSYGQANYYVATAADSLFINPSGSLSWQGLGVNIEFYTKLLEKLGVEMQVVKVGTFKSAVEPYMLTKMSEPNKLQYNTLLGDIWQKMSSDVSSSRDIALEQLNALADKNMLLQPQDEYVQTHLVDGLCYSQDMDDLLTKLTGTDDYELLDYDDMASIRNTKVLSKPNLAVLYAEGAISDAGQDGIIGKKMVETIDEIAEDDNIQAVVFRVNSPGGSAYASEQINHAIALLKEKKPVVVSMGDYAASGGYYISCNANYIYAEPTTLTGSIGIFGLIPNVKKLTDKVGLSIDGVETHQHSNLETDIVMRGMTAQERDMLQAEINRGYELFTRRCAEGRGISQDVIKKIGEGRVWSGVRAKEIGLVDELGSLQDALAKAAELAGLEDYEVAEYPEPEDLWEKMMKSFKMSAQMEAWITRILGSERYQMICDLENMQAKPSIQARLPYYIEIR